MREQRHLEAIQAIKECDYNCYIKACVGFGKTVLSQRVLHQMFLEGVLPKGSKVLFQTSGVQLLASFLEEVKLCKELFGFDITELFEVTTACYQSRLTLKQEFDYIINDEFDYCGEVFGVDLIECPTKMLCMSGTVDDKTPFLYKGQMLTKKQWIELKLPLAFAYTIEQGIQDGIVVNFETTLVYHNLDNTAKYGKIWKNQAFPFSEQEFYKKAKEASEKFMFFDEQEVMSRLSLQVKTVNPKRIRDKNVLALVPKLGFEAAFVQGKLKTEREQHKRMRENYTRLAVNLVQATPSKINPLRRLIKETGGRSIVWANHLDYLGGLLGEEYVLTEDNPCLEGFNDKTLHLIGTSKKILRGVTPKEVDNLFMLCPMGTHTPFNQLIGRVIRTDHRPDKIAKLFIVVTVGTYAENWLIRGCQTESGVFDLNIKNVIWI